MEQLGSGVPNQTTGSTAPVFSNNKNISSKVLPWSEEDDAMFLCRLCNKTFYNALALRNHRNLQHDGDGVSSEDEIIDLMASQRAKQISSFKFIPLKKEREDQTFQQQNGLTSRVFSEDTTYIVVKLQGEETDVTAAKRRRLEGLVKRAQMKPGKPPIDLRGPFTCTFPSMIQPELQCRQIFFNCCEYSMHYREQHTKRRKAALRCQVCEKRLDRDPPQLAPLAPPPRISFSCRACGLTFTDATLYDDHNRVFHAKMKPYQCTLCAKRFTQQGGLQQHMRMHTGIRPFVCSFCQKSFTQKAGLDQHLRTHTKVKPFKCVVCSKSFSQSVHLRQHMRTHTNIQPFECSVCGRRFKQTSHLNFHMRSHAGELHSAAMEGFGRSLGSEYLQLANVQPMRHGDAIYYAAELAPQQSLAPFGFSRHLLNDNVLSI